MKVTLTAFNAPDSALTNRREPERRPLWTASRPSTLRPHAVSTPTDHL
ncbi:hypothetical protein [Kibdelosporangium philippinense]